MGILNGRNLLWKNTNSLCAGLNLYSNFCLERHLHSLRHTMKLSSTVSVVCCNALPNKSSLWQSEKKVSKRLSLSVQTCTLGVFKTQYKSGKDKALQHFYTWECCLLRINTVIYTAALQTFDFIVLAAVWIRYTGMLLRCDQILRIFPPKLFCPATLTTLLNTNIR